MNAENYVYEINKMLGQINAMSSELSGMGCNVEFHSTSLTPIGKPSFEALEVEVTRTVKVIPKPVAPYVPPQN